MERLFVNSNQIHDILRSSNGQSRLSDRTEVKSGYEEIFRDCLLRLGVQARYEPFSCILDPRYSQGARTYTPDFVTDLTFNGRQVILEPHPMGGHGLGDMFRDIAKFREFKRRYGESFYLVVASDLHPHLVGFRTGLQVSTFSHAYWEIPNIRVPEGFWYPSTRERVMQHLEDMVVTLRK